MRKPVLLIVAIVLLVGGLWSIRSLQHAPPPDFAPPSLPAPAQPSPVEAARDQPGDDAALPAFLPAEARQTVALIQRGGPYPHAQDGSVFGNREGRLPQRPRGYYREYTVDTPGLSHRGARRIVTGGDPPQAWYYSEDHYENFLSFEVPARVQP